MVESNMQNSEITSNGRPPVREHGHGFEEENKMIAIPSFRCPACGGDVLQIDKHFLEWECSKCGRIWGIEVKKPVFKLGV